MDNLDADDVVKKLRKRKQQERFRELEDLRRVANTPEGFRVLWRILSFCRVFQTPYSKDPIEMANAVGMQDVGRFIMDELNHADGEVIGKYIIENAKLAKRENNGN